MNNWIIHAETFWSDTTCWQPLLKSHHVSTSSQSMTLSDTMPVAAMSRPVAGVRGKSLILTLPGSPKGAKENLQAVLKLLPHACLQAAGGDSRAMHAGGVKKLEAEAGLSARDKASSKGLPHHPSGHHHHHGHDHGHKIPKAHTSPEERLPRSNDPTLGATRRHRSSPYPILSVADAVSIILEHAPPPNPTSLPLSPALVGHVIASDVHAAEAVPAYRASIVDGYAIIVPAKDSQHSDGTKGTFPVASVSNAQASSMPPPLAEATIARITTGAPLPPNANAVVMVEDTSIVSTTADGTEEATVEILTKDIQTGENVREPGSDIQLNTLLLPKGTPITSLGGEIGLLAAAGIHTVPVFTKPRIGVLSTGDEITDTSPDQQAPLSGGQIRDSNRPSLLSLLHGWNLCSTVIDLGIARDTPPDALERALRSAFATHDLDVVVTTGGVSMGELDLLKPTVERDMGGTVHFGRVSMKPGKPTTFASVPVKGVGSGERVERLVFGLPGNPASAVVTANLFVLPALRRMVGLEGRWGLERVMVRLEARVRCDRARVEYHRVLVRCGREGVLLAASTGMQRSSRVGSLARANALLVLPEREGWVEEGEMCEALMMGPLVGFGET
jgi:gephyrin